MHLSAVVDLVNGSRTDDRPIEVESLGLGLFRVLNGRHRFLAALIRGEQYVEVEIRRLRDG